MKTEDLKKTNEELQEEIKKNNEQIAVSDERTRIAMANVNQFEYKVIETLKFSMLPYLGLVVLSTVLTKNGTMTSITSAIPAESLTLIISGSSLVVGNIGRKILEWKFKTKERFKSFTTTKSQSEKIQEEVKYAVELEKAKNRNKAIKQIMDSLNSNQSILNLLSSRYDINDKTLPQTREESQKRVEELSTLLKGKYNELDVLTTQKVLHEKFWRVRTKGEKLMEIMMVGMMGGMFTMAYGNMPIIIMRDLLANSPSLMSLFAPIIVGVVGVSGYMVKRNKDYEKTFNILNSELGENALPDKIKEAYEEQQDIDSKIESKMREISIVGIRLQEQKRIMESFTDDSNKKEKTLESSVAKEHTIEETRKDTIFGQNQEDLMTFMDEDIFDGKEIEPQIEEKGPSLVLRRKLNNTQNPQK